MADTYSFCLVGIMDQLWFHQAILCTQPINPLLSNPNILNTHQDPGPDTFTDSTDIVSTVSHEVMQPEDQYENSCLSPSDPSMLMDESDSKVKDEKGDRPTRVDSLGSSRARSRSQSSPDRPRIKTFSGSKSMKKWTSCKDLEYLEMEEVKGLMDLGFIFQKEHLSPRMMSLVPGLQRLNVLYKKQEQEQEEEEEELEMSSEEEEEKIKNIQRPYLSEAWLIRRPKSPLLNLHAAPKAEIKQHLKSWARSVAAVVEQES